MKNAGRFLVACFFACAVLLPRPLGVGQGLYAATSSAWPMFGHDAQHTNRSPYVGPMHPHLLATWSYMYPDPVIGSDGTIDGWTEQGITQLDSALKPAWSYPAYELDGGPLALGPDGSIRAVGSTTNTTSVPTSEIVALSNSGTLLWKVQPAAFTKGAAPLLTDTNRLYVPYAGPTGDYQELDAVSSTGQVQQHLLHGSAIFAVAQGNHHVVYALHQDNDPSPTYDPRVGLSAFSSVGKRLWKRRVGIGESSAALLIGRDGAVYASVPGRLVKYSAKGRVIWIRTIDKMYATLAERPDGSVLVASDLSAAAYTSSGRKLWHTRFKDGPPTSGRAASLLVDAVGTAYVGTSDGTLRIMTLDGHVSDVLPFGPRQPYGSLTSLALDAGGRLIAVGTDYVLRVYGQ